MINLIAAITYYPEKDQFIIGAGGKLPHESPEDMARFKRLTTGGVVIMGRKTLESMKGALPDRENIILSRDPSFILENSWVKRSLEEAIEKAKELGSEIWIIGGGEVYREALAKDIPDRLYISEMKGHYEFDHFQVSNTTIIFGDEIEITYFPRVNMHNYKALYIEQFEDHALKILSKTSLDVV